VSYSTLRVTGVSVSERNGAPLQVFITAKDMVGSTTGEDANATACIVTPSVGNVELSS